MSEFFDEKAKDYTETVRSNRGSSYVASIEESFLRKYLKKYLHNKKNLILYDLGIGNGRMSKIVWDHFDDDVSIYGVDFSKEMINKTKRIISAKNIYSHDLNDKFNYHIEPENKADLVISFRVIKYIKRIDNLIYTLNKLTKRDSYIILQFANKYSSNIILRFLAKLTRNEELKIYANSLVFYSINQIKRKLSNEFEVVEHSGNVRLPYFIYNFFAESYFLKPLILLEEILNKILPSAFLSRDFIIVAKKR